MKRELVIAAPAVPPGPAAWIRHNVLSRSPSPVPGRKWQGPDLTLSLTDLCECQWGLCGYCQDLAQHDQCAHRKGTAPVPDGHETWLISARGSALTPVWVRQVFDGERPGCRWVCPCQECERIGPPLLPQAVTDALPPLKRIVGPLSGQKALF